MSSMELFGILGEIDEKFYEEALAAETADDGKPIKLNVSSGRKKPFLVAAIAAAACLIIGAGAGLAIHLNSREDIDVVPNTSDNFGEFSAADIEDCKQQIFAAYPDIRKYEQVGDKRALQTRAMDINCDGTEEAVLYSNGEKLLFVFVKTEDGMTLTDTVNMPGFVFCVGDINDLHRYDDGESYWYYGIYAGKGDEFNDVNAMGRIAYEDGSFAVDFPLAYGRFGRDAFCKTDMDYTKGESSLVNIGSDSNITREEFEVLWSKYTSLPKFILYFFGEYPPVPVRYYKDMIPVITDTSDMSEAIEKARIVQISSDDPEIWLVGENIYRTSENESSYLRAKTLEIALVKSSKIVSKEKINIASAAPDELGYIEFEWGDFKYLRLYRLKDTQIVVFGFTNGEGTPGADPVRESAFFAVKDEKLIPLRGTTSAGGSEVGYSTGAGASMTVLENALLDEGNDRIYTFAPENFDKDPSTAPHFTTEKYDHNIFDLDRYVKYDPSSSEQVPLAVLTEKTVGGNIVKLLGHNVQTVFYGVPRTAFTAMYIAVERDGKEVCRTKAITDSQNFLIAEKLDDYIFTFEMKDGIGFGLYNTAYQYNNTSYALNKARLYSIDDDNTVNLFHTDDYNYNLIDLTNGFTIVPEENKIVFSTDPPYILNFGSHKIYVGEVPQFKGGKIFGRGKGPSFDMPFIGSECGTETEWNRWMDIINSGEIGHIDIELHDYGEDYLSDKKASQIMTELRGAQMKLLEEIGNPVEGGGYYAVYAYDKNGKLLLEIIYNKYWLTVQFRDDGVCYMFDGENCGLDDLISIMRKR